MLHILLSQLRLPIWRARIPYLYPPGTEWPISVTTAIQIPGSGEITAKYVIKIVVNLTQQMHRIKCRICESI
jgi:hypothetical protein